MQSRLSTYFQQRYGYTIPWSRIKLCREGWALRFGSLLCPTNDATTIATPWGYEIHYREGIPEPVLAHELAHIMRIERDGYWRYVARYAAELVRVGYREVSYEREARRCAEEYYLFLKKY